MIVYPSAVTIAGQSTAGTADGFGTNAAFSSPDGISIHPDGSYALLGCYSTDHRVRKVLVSSGLVSVFAGSATISGSTNGIGTNALFYQPRHVSFSRSGEFAYVSEHLGVRVITISTVLVGTLAGSGVSGMLDGVGTNAKFSNPYISVVSRDGTFLLLADIWNNRIRKIIISTQQVSTLFGSGATGSINGVGTNAQLNQPHGIALSSDESYCLMTTLNDNLIRKADMSSLQVVTVAGQAGVSGLVDGVGTMTRFYGPVDVKLLPGDSEAIICEYRNSAFRKLILSTYQVSTIIGSPPGYGDGSGTNARFNGPTVLGLSGGSYGFVTDRVNNRIRRIDFTGIPQVLPFYLKYS